MSLAKAFFDVGLFTNQRDAQQRFWSEQVGLPFDHTLKLGGGILQHRYSAGEAVLKLNDARDPLPSPAAMPIIEILVGIDGLTQKRALQDPDGNRITLLPAGTDGITGLAVRLRVAELDRSQRFYTDVLGCDLLAPGMLRCADARILLEQGDTPASDDQPALAALGLRYLTLQVFDCDLAYAQAMANGASGAREPVTLGSTARIAFIRDPDGVWIELSERASVTGKPVA